MNFFQNIYYFICCKRKPITPEEITVLRKKRMELLPGYSKLMDKKYKGTQNIREL